MQKLNFYSNLVKRNFNDKKQIHPYGSWFLYRILIIALFCITMACSRTDKATDNVLSDLETIEVDMIPQLDAALFESDRGGSYVGFRIMHLGLNKIRGVFSRFSAAVIHNPSDPYKTSITIKVNLNSLDTRSGGRDRDLMSPRFFDEAKYPIATFMSTRVKKVDDQWLMLGDLTIKGVTRSVEVPYRVTTPEIVIIPGRKDYMIHLEGSVKVNRNDFNVTGGGFAGGIIADEVEIEFSLLARQQNFDQITFNPNALPSVGQIMQDSLTNKSIEEVITLYKEMKQSRVDEFNFGLFELEILSRKLLHHKKYRDALALFEFMTELDPNYTRAFLKIGEIQCFLDQQPDALRAFKSAVKIDSTNVVALEMSRHLSEQ